jgi:hypothetical protein
MGYPRIVTSKPMHLLITRQSLARRIRPPRLKSSDDQISGTLERSPLVGDARRRLWSGRGGLAQVGENLADGELVLNAGDDLHRAAILIAHNLIRS